ncbi:MAG: imidazoleglycerol-phosphate dehydratase HisB, partial [Balneolaceae bacterium]
EQIARHGLVDLDIRCSGDLNVDEHHTIEDVAITLGEALFQVCGTDKTGIQRYGFLLAMDESQAEVALDLSGRPYFVWNAEFRREYAGDFPLEMAEHFFHTLAMNLKATLQIRADGKNDHHKLESIFKGFARSLRFAVTRTERSIGLLPSSKELL